MKFKKSLLIICLIICIFTMASVSATDVNDTAIASEDTDQMELSTDDGITEDTEIDFTIQEGGMYKLVDNIFF